MLTFGGLAHLEKNGRFCRHGLRPVSRDGAPDLHKGGDVTRLKCVGHIRISQNLFRLHFVGNVALNGDRGNIYIKFTSFYTFFSAFTFVKSWV